MSPTTQTHMGSLPPGHVLRNYVTCRGARRGPNWGPRLKEPKRLLDVDALAPVDNLRSARHLHLADRRRACAAVGAS